MSNLVSKPQVSLMGQDYSSEDRVSLISGVIVQNGTGKHFNPREGSFFREHERSRLDLERLEENFRLREEALAFREKNLG